MQSLLMLYILSTKPLNVSTASALQIINMLTLFKMDLYAATVLLK